MAKAKKEFPYKTIMEMTEPSKDQAFMKVIMISPYGLQEYSGQMKRVKNETTKAYSKAKITIQK